MNSTTFAQKGTGLRFAARGTAAALGAFFLSCMPVAANALPVPVLDTHCMTSATNTVRTCEQTGGIGDVFSQANLNNLSATARLDLGPYSLVARAALVYYFTVTSDSGPIHDWVPLSVEANGTTAVGHSGGAVGGAGFNNNTATANVRINSTSVFSACSGHGCPANSAAAFSGSRTAWVQPYSSGSDVPTVLQVILEASVTTNANYEHSYAHAYVDPIIRIDPAYLAANPGLTLSFSEGVPNIPLPATAWLMLSGLLGLVEARRRQRR